MGGWEEDLTPRFAQTPHLRLYGPRALASSCSSSGSASRRGCRSPTTTVARRLRAACCSRSACFRASTSAGHGHGDGTQHTHTNSLSNTHMSPHPLPMVQHLSCSRAEAKAASGCHREGEGHIAQRLFHLSKVPFTLHPAPLQGLHDSTPLTPARTHSSCNPHPCWDPMALYPSPLQGPVHTAHPAALTPARTHLLCNHRSRLSRRFSFLGSTTLVSTPGDREKGP